MVSTFNAKLVASDGTDLLNMLPGFGRPQRKYTSAQFEYPIKKLAVHTSTWLPSRTVKLSSQTLTLQDLAKIIRDELSTKLTPEEKLAVLAKHRRTYDKEASTVLYRTRQHAFHPVEHPQWILKPGRSTGSWVLQAFR